MAVRIITAPQSYIGTAAERGAMSTTGLPVGSKFFETDNNLYYIWDGAAWHKLELMTIA